MSILRAILSVILLVTVTSTTSVARKISVPSSNNLLREAYEINYRLPSNVKPSYYDIKISVPSIYADEFTFEGVTSINITVLTNDTRAIILHAKDLVLEESSTNVIGNGKHIKPTNQTIDNTTDFLILNFTKTALVAGEYVLNLRYTGQLNNESYGFYRSSFIDHWDKEVWLAATNFKATHARRAFPCFDEPAMKAKFEISIEHLQNYTAISNMPATRETIDKNDHGYRWTRFRVTPVMSTYQVAFAIYDIENLISENNDNFRVWSRQSQTSKADYARTIGRTNLKLFERYLSFKHAIPKMDNFVIPQLSIDGTSSWGLVTFRESALFFEENVTMTCEMQETAMVMAREFTYQWFGGVMSPRWWGDAWIHEGLANYFQYFMNDQAETEWRMMEQFVIKNLQETAFLIDDDNFQHSFNTAVNSPTGISGIFDKFPASKAGCLIRMFSHVLGAKVFRTGLKAYLKNGAYGAATTDNFIEALITAKGAAADVNLEEFLKTWINNPSYPVVLVDHVSISHSAKQMCYAPKKRTCSEELTWHIPLTYVYQQDNPNFNNTHPDRWVTSQSTVWWTGPDVSNWVIYNTRAIGYYRVQYTMSTSIWDRIVDYLKTTSYSEIPPTNRAQLLDDLFVLTESEYYDTYNWFLKTSAYLHQEDDYVPWYAAFRAFSVLNQHLMNTENYNLFKLYILSLTETLEKNVGYVEKTNDDHTKKLNRINFVYWSCKMGSVNCNTVAYEKLLHYVFESKKISVDYRRVILCAGIRTANLSIWEKTLLRYEQSKNRAERQDILDALGCSAHPIILKHYLAKSLNSKFKLSLKNTIKTIVAETEFGVDVAMDFVDDNCQAIIDTVGGKECILDSVNYIASRMTSEDQYEKLEMFINSLLADNKDLADALTNNALRIAMENLEWLQKYENDISTFLKDQHLGEENIMMTHPANLSR